MLHLVSAARVAAARAVKKMAEQAGAAFATVTRRLQRVGFKGGSISELLAWAKEDPTRFWSIFLAFASIGLDVERFLSEEGEDGKSVVEALGKGRTAELSRARDYLPDGRIAEAADASAALDLPISEKQLDLHLAAELVRWARRHYGSDADALQAHAMHQAFFEMPHDDVATALRLLK